MFNLLKMMMIKAKLVNNWFYLKIYLLLIVIAAEVSATSLFPYARQYFFSMIENKQVSLFWHAIGLMVFVSIALVISQSLKTWLGGLISLNMRIALTNILSKEWTKSPHVENADNPDQRISEDTRLSTDLMLSNYIEMAISGAIVIIMIIQASMHHHMIWLAVGYIALSLAIAKLFRKPLITREIDVQRSEATFRRSLVDIHQGHDDSSSKNKFGEVIKNVTSIITLTRNYNMFGKFQEQMMYIVPYIVLVPMYLNGVITFGEVMGMSGVFDLLVLNATIIIKLYPNITKSAASWRRIVEFHDKLYTSPITPAFNAWAWIDSIKRPAYSVLKIAVVLIVLIRI